MSNGVTPQLHPQFCKTREMAHPLIVEKDVIIVVANVFHLDEVGADQPLTLLILRLVDRIPDGLGEIHIVREHHGQGLPIRDGPQRHGAFFCRAIDRFQQAQPDIQGGVELIIIGLCEFLSAIVVPLQKQKPEIQSDRVGPAPGRRLPA